MEEFSRVRIKSKGATGMIVDVDPAQNGKTYYWVECDEDGIPGEYGYDEDWDLFYLTEDDIEPI